MGQYRHRIQTHLPDLGGGSISRIIGSNAMVQLTPVTKFRSGSGYQYEDTVIYGFAHTSKGHWNLCHIPLLPATGIISPDDYSSSYSHKNESAHPGYYQVFLSVTISMLN